MDQAIKTYVTLFFTFLLSMFLVTILSFGIVSNNARSSLYTIVDYLEVSGYDKSVVDSYAQKSNLEIEVTPCLTDELLNGGNKIRYKVDVTFSHVIAWINFKPTITLTAYTRAVEY